MELYNIIQHHKKNYGDKAGSVFTHSQLGKCVCEAVGRSPTGLVHLGTWSVSLDRVLSLASPC